MNTNLKLSAILLFSMIFISISCFAQKTEKTSKKGTKKSTAKKDESSKEKNTYAIISTGFGDMELMLYNETPYHRDNFVKLVNEGFYDSLLFHRVILNFMIQGGDPESKNAEAGKMLGNGGPGYTIPAEFVSGKFHKKGALAAARMGDEMNPTKASSGSQFYIVQGQKFTEEQIDQVLIGQRGMQISPEQREAYTTVGGSPWLDGQYTVFGEVVKGFEVIDAIATVKTDRSNRPLEDVRMTIKIVTK